jgi:hypothetical protein
MFIVTPIIVCLSGLEIISYILDEDEEFYINH